MNSTRFETCSLDEIQLMNPMAPEQPDRAERVVKMGRSRLLDWIMDSRGTKLRDSDHDLMREVIDRYFDRSRVNSHHGNWIRLIKQATPANKTPGECLTEQDAQAFWERAHGINEPIAAE